MKYFLFSRLSLNTRPTMPIIIKHRDKTGIYERKGCLIISSVPKFERQKSVKNMNNVRAPVNRKKKYIMAV
jgi:hypothetical protein